MIRSFRASCFILLAICGVSTLQVETARAAGCEDFVPPSCTRIKAGDKIDTIVKDKCYVLDENSTGSNTYDKINVLSGGKILFVDPGFDSGQQKPRTIQFKVSALLIEKGGVVQAGSPSCPFGKEGGQLAIGLYGNSRVLRRSVPLALWNLVADQAVFLLSRR